MSDEEISEKEEVTLNLNPDETVKTLNGLSRLSWLLLDLTGSPFISFQIEVKDRQPLTFTVKKD